jgi:L-threonylcarbamoyladenylate synthase
VYGLAADIMRADAVGKVFRIKARSHAKAVPVFVRDVEMAKRYAFVERELEKLLNEMWPGPTTAVLQKKPAMPDAITGGMSTVGLRVPDHPFMRLLLERYPNPLTGTSANLSGSEPASSSTDIQKIFRTHIPRPDLVIDGGPLPASPPSTVVDLTRPDNPKILRLGAITKGKLDEFLKQWQEK